MDAKHSWEKAYRDDKFKITTLSPSVVVNKYKNLLKKGDFVLDVGSGNGRNSMFLASSGCIVDSFDVVDLNWISKLSEELRKNITFTQSDILEFGFKPDFYKAVVVTRVIQYLNKIELNYLFDKLYTSLKSDGFLLLSYNAKGGVFFRKEIDVFKYPYPIEEVVEMLKSRFKKVDVYLGATKSQNVNYSDDIMSYDIFVSGKNIAL